MRSLNIKVSQLIVAGLSCLALFFAGCAVPLRQTDEQVSEQGVAEEVDHNCSYFYFLWGRHAELRLRFDEALEAYEKALICDPTAEYIQKKTPVLLLRMGRNVEAEKLINAFLDRQPDDLGMNMLSAVVDIRNNRRERAIETYRFIMRKDPDNPQPGLRLAGLFMEEQDFENARMTLSRLLERDKNLYQAHVMMGRLYEETGDLTTAIDHYRRALESDWSVDVLMVIGDLLVQRGEFEEALDIYREVLEYDEHHFKARVALFQVYHQLGMDSRAIEELEQIRSLTLQSGLVNLTIAKLYIQKKRYDEAITLLESVIAEDDLSEARYLLARLYYRDGRYGPALELLTGLDEEFQRESFFLRLRLLQLLEREAEATVMVDQLIDRTDIAVEEKLAALATLYAMGDLSEDIHRLYQKGIDTTENQDIWHYEYGLFLEYIGMREEALLQMQQVIAINPDHAAALNYVGYTWADENRNLELAFEYLKRAAALKPENGYIRDSLGWVYFRLGRIEEAVKELEAAVKLSPDDPAIYDHLGDVYLMQGNREKAIEAYQKAIDLYDDDIEKSQAVEIKLQQIEKR